MIKQIVKSTIKRQIQRSLVCVQPKVKVNVNQGTIKGVIESLPDGRKFQRFSGIPYAKPPVGELRYRAPQKLMKFDKDEIDCTGEGNQCIQKSLFYQIWVGSEDCLNLNVYVPNDVEMKNLPVMVWIYGGAFSFGSGNRDLYSPEFLLMEDVIVVTMNYRLHFHGFACIPEMGINGNAGLKDQQMALEWVHENIENFGGDKSNITLFGESAGGGSAHVHTLNAKSRQYFHKMINMSWNSIGDYFLQHDPVGKTKKIVELFKGRTDTPKATYESLMKLNLKDIFKRRLKVQEPYELRRNIPIIIKPHIEEESDDAFLTKLPIDILKEEGSKIDIPTMSGITNGEGVYQILYYLKRLAITDREFYRFVPMTLNVDPVSPEGLQFAKEMKSYYMGERGLRKETLPLVRDFFTDINYRIHTTLCVEATRKFSPNTKQFFYEFGLESKLNYWKSNTPLKNLPGTMHADELAYLFDYKLLGQNYKESSNEWKYRRMTCRMWTNFAKFTNPTPDHDLSLPSEKWQPVNPEFNSPINYYKITNDGNSMASDFNGKTMEFWRRAYEKYNGDFLNPKYDIVRH